MPVSVKNRFLLLYGSQTGQAKAISEEIAEKAEKINMNADLHCLSQTEKKFNIEREHCIVIVTSTTGDGEPPDTAQKFVRRLKKKTLPSNYLENLNYTVLGLGDSNYTNFCNNGKTVDRRLEQLGAKRFYDSGWADDAVGLEVAVEPWMEGLFSALQKFLGVGSGITCTTTAEQNARLSQHENGIDGTSHIESIILKNKLTEDSSSEESCSVFNGKSELEKNKIMNNDKRNSLNNGLSDSTNNQVISSEVNGHDRIRTNLDSQSNSHDSLTQSDSKNSEISSNITLSQLTKSDSDQLKRSDSRLNSFKENSNQKETASSNQIGESRTIGVCQPSLTLSLPPLSESSISVPVLPAEYLKIEYQEEQSINICDIPLQNGCQLPSAASSVLMATIKTATVLTREDSVKKTLSLKLDTEKNIVDYMPGDSMSVIVKNEEKEVDSLLKRLGVLEHADKTCCLSVIEGTKKRNASVPQHIPPQCTLRHIFITCVDIREPPKKALLRVFIEHTTDQSEKRRLQELCSKQGASDYTQFIRQPSLSLLDILLAFPSCNPPVERLLECLPRLHPRPYSVCSSPLVNPGTIEIVFNIIDIPPGDGRSYSRIGVCTGMLDKLTNLIQSKHISTEDTVDSLSSTIQNLDVTCSSLELTIFNRTNQHFRMSDDLSIPIIMIGPGTGVAPFVGFLRHREVLKRDMSEPEVYGDTWLFYGCRHENRDYIFRKELEAFQINGVLSNLCVCFSRDDQSTDAPRYVQDNIRKYSAELSALIMEKNATIFVCGDAENMAKDVNQAIMSVIQSYKGCSEDEARAEVMKMRLHKRYLEDVWT